LEKAVDNGYWKGGWWQGGQWNSNEGMLDRPELKPLRDAKGEGIDKLRQKIKDMARLEASRKAG
jgi:hypothetical protein